jgi:hypothetical protein|tara:strand:+ start:56 stop:463 length:408 start_codon:yes stop_codon:yes gene_type:complete
MMKKNQTHERLVKKTFETTRFHRYFFIIFFSFVCFNLLTLDDRNFYILSFFLIVLIVSNVFVLINNNKFFKFISNLPVNFLSTLLDLTGTFMLSVFYFLILTPFSILRKKTTSYSFLDKMWVDIEKNKIDFENGF